MGREVGGCCAPFSRGAGSPFNTMLPGPRPTSAPSGIFIHPAVWSQQTWAENWALCPFGGAGSPCNTMSPRPMSTSLSSGILIRPADWPQQTWAENWEAAVPFGHNRHGSKRGCCCSPFWGCGTGPHLTQCRLSRALPP